MIPRRAYQETGLFKSDVLADFIPEKNLKVIQKY